ncbi:MAG: DUF456 domain-containing protein [Nocardioidaceae bacterium]|nr:DUF456 domain-containing protein [Nocardioidaceae bacterium]
MTGGEALVAVVIAIGVVGVVLPVIPGSLLVGGAITAWALETGGATAWTVCGVAVALLVTAAVGKWWVAERHLRGAGVSRTTILIGGLTGIVGFFVIPVIGLVLGFVAGVYVAERRRHSAHQPAWRATVTALKASGLAILVELAGALFAAAVWILGVATT